MTSVVALILTRGFLGFGAVGGVCDRLGLVRDFLAILIGAGAERWRSRPIYFDA